MYDTPRASASAKYPMTPGAALSIMLPADWQKHVGAAVACDHQEAQMKPEAVQHAQTQLLSDPSQLHQQAPQAPQSLTHQRHHPELHPWVLLAILSEAAGALHVTEQAGSAAMLRLDRLS